MQEDAGPKQKKTVAGTLEGLEEGPSLHGCCFHREREITNLFLIHIEVIFLSLLQFIQVYGAHKDLQRRTFDVVMQL